ncbi:MAG: hypothetical protein PHW66_09350 [Gallionella sp.]|nr:hypothetical protein [Gallionella sp.]
MRFIRDDIRVRDLDKRYKKVMRHHAGVFTTQAFRWTPYHHHTRFLAWAMSAVIEKLALKGA